MSVFVFTIVAVSADAYLAGLSLSNIGKYPLLKVLFAASFTWLLSSLFVIASSYVGGRAEIVLKILSAGILIVIGVKNLRGCFEERLFYANRTFGFKHLSLIGVSVALDAAVASVTLTEMPHSAWTVPLCMFAGHFLFLWAGCRTAELVSLIYAINRLSGLILIVLGVIRLITL